jgi:hypothetical protein
VSLVHATNGSITDTHIRPSSAPTRSGKQIEGVFGARKSLNSLAYAFRVPGTLESIISPIHSFGLNVPIMIIHSKQKYLNQLSKVGHIIEMPEHYFSPEPDKDGKVLEYISRQPIPLTDCKINRVNFQDALKQGLQIFFMKLKNSDDSERIQKKLISLSNLEDLRKMITSGDLEYYNQTLKDQGLNVSLIDFDNNALLNTAVKPESSTNPATISGNSKIKIDIPKETTKNLQPLLNASEKLINRVVELFLQGAKEGLFTSVTNLAQSYFKK